MSGVKGKSGLPKGKTNNPHGKPKGTKNKLTSDLKDRMTTFLEGNFDKFTQDMNSIEDKGLRSKLYIEAYKMVVPKPKDPDDIDKENEFRDEFMRRLGLNK